MDVRTSRIGYDQPTEPRAEADEPELDGYPEEFETAESGAPALMRHPAAVWARGWGIIAVRARYAFLIGLLLAIATVFGFCLARWRVGQYSADVSVLVTGQIAQGEEVAISVIATNRGKVQLVYQGDPPSAELRVETATGWTNVPQRYLSKSGSFGFLMPGGAVSYRFVVPRSAKRFQVGCYFHTGGAKTWLVQRLLETDAGAKLFQLLGPVLPHVPNGPEEDVLAWSPETEIR